MISLRSLSNSFNIIVCRGIVKFIHQDYHAAGRLLLTDVITVQSESLYGEKTSFILERIFRIITWRRDGDEASEECRNDRLEQLPEHMRDNANWSCLYRDV